MVNEAPHEKVLLVVPPFSSAQLPNLGVAQLKANLVRAGYPTEVLYLNLAFAERIGYAAAEWISSALYSNLLGEFIFSTALFDNNSSRSESYISALRDNATMVQIMEQLFPNQSQLALLAEYCAAARDFCDGEGLDAILASNARVVGFSTSFQQNCAALALLKRLKNKRPDVVTVTGGANCTSDMGRELLIQFPEIDYVGEGECDHTLVALLDRLSAGATTHEITGIFSRHPLCTLQSSRTLTGTDLDALPFPDFDDYFEQFANYGFDKLIRPMLTMETARGCWWGAKHHCTFCGLNQSGMHFRSKSPERALEEIEWLIDRYGPHKIAVADNILDMQYFKNVIPGLAETKRTTFFYETKANLSREQVRMLAAARINSIQPGIESLNDESLRLMRKGVSKVQNVQLLKWCAEYGVKVVWNYLIGFPGENEDEFSEIADEVELLHHLDPPTGSSMLRLDRFSPYYNEPEEFGLAPIKLAEVYRQVYPLPDDALARIAYFFESDHLNEKANSDGVSVIQKMVKRWLQEHQRSYLLAMPRRDALIIIDTRHCARRWVHRLTGLRRAIYEHCDAAHSLSNIVKAIADQANAEDVEAVVDSLVRDRLLLASNDRYVSLGVVPECRLTYENILPIPLRVQQASGRCMWIKRNIERLGRLLLEPRKMAPKIKPRLIAAWCRRRNQLIRRAVLLAANLYSETKIERI